MSSWDFFLKSATGSIVANFHKGGYYEMISIYSRWRISGGYKKALHKNGERFVKVVLQLDRADAEAKRLKSMGKKVLGPLIFNRDFTIQNKGKLRALFSIMSYPFPFDYPISVSGTEHLTPEITWQEELLDHANGTQLLANVLVVFDNLEDAAAEYGRYWNMEFQKDGFTQFVRLKNGSRITFVAKDNLKQILPDVKPTTSPYIAAIYFGVANLQTTKKLFEENDVPFKEMNNKLIVPKEYVFNSTYIFEEMGV